MTHWMEGDWPDASEVEDERDTLLKGVVEKVRDVLRSLPSQSLGEQCDDAIGELEMLVDTIAGRYEDDDPRSMGWVSDSGLP